MGYVSPTPLSLRGLGPFGALNHCQMLPKCLPRGSRSAKGVSTLLPALEMLIRAGVKTGIRASTRSSSRRYALPQGRKLAVFELNVDDHARVGYELSQDADKNDLTTTPRCPDRPLLAVLGLASLYSMDMVSCKFTSLLLLLLRGSGT